MASSSSQVTHNRRATLTEEEREYLLKTLRMNEDMANSISQELWEIAVNTARQALAAQVEEEEELVRDQDNGRIIFHDDLCNEQPVPKSLTRPPWNEEKEY
ncbi:hypothetical protein HK096_011185, partial [Nowakowskiella sp. JEL0078]